jgi:hypothetical protein
MDESEKDELLREAFDRGVELETKYNELMKAYKRLHDERVDHHHCYVDGSPWLMFKVGCAYIGLSFAKMIKPTIV